MIDPGELEQMRLDIMGTLPETCNVITVTYAQDAYGNPQPTLGTVGINIPCRMDAKTGRETMAGGAIQSYQGNILTLPYGTQISITNRIEYAGNVYGVIAISEGSWLSCLRVSVERV